MEGKYVSNDLSPYCVTGDKLKQLETALGIKFDVDKKLQMSADQKRDFLNMILWYFKLHLDGFKEPKSLAVLNEVFN